MFLFSIFLSIFLLKSSLVNASYNGLSIVNLAALAKSEVLISTEIHKLAKESSHFVKSFPYVPEYLEDYKLARGNLDVWDVASNPIAAYAMISRYVYLLDKLMGDIHQRGNYDELESLQRLLNVSAHWRDEHDMGAVLGNVFKLQYIFDLEPEDLAVGRIGKTETGISLPFEHILEIAEAAIEFKEFTASAAWLRLAKDKKIPGHEQVWAELVRRHDEAFTDESKNLHLFEHPLATHPDAAPIKFRNLEKWKDATLAEMEADLTASHYATLALCRAGDTLRGGWKLRGCWYDYQYIKGPHGPLLPVRVEQLTDDPDGLVMFRDYIPTQWVKKLKEISLPEMPFQEPPSHWQQGEPSVAGFAWFEDVDVARDQNVWIARKLELTTGLSVVGNIASEKLRVTLYSLVGQISPHHDAYSIFSNSAEDSSLYLDRISTMLIYLNTVELGGSTVFPVAGVAVAPREGDAIFWHSRWRNGTVDKRWLHAACPIPLGVKWTASKWVKNDGNAFSRKCDINSQL